MRQVAVGNELGEGIIWDHHRARFLWTDIQGRRLHAAAPDGTDHKSWELPHRLACFGLSDDPDTIMAAFDQGFAHYEIETRRLSWINRPALPPGVRFNDGRVDPMGRLVAGTMVEQSGDRTTADAGALLRLEADGTTKTLLTGIAISNALCWSPDGATMYHADSPTGALCCYDYQCGMPKDRRVIARYGPGEVPDGATVDADGNIWVAIWGGSRVDCLTPGGQLLASIRVPMSQPTCVAFGGANLNQLAITSAWQGLAVTAESRPATAGDLIIVDPECKGLPERVLAPAFGQAGANAMR